MTRPTPPNGTSRAPAACRLGLAGAMTLPFLFSPVSAFAAVNPVPAAPRNVVVFPERDFVGADGFAPGTALAFRVLRNGVRIGSASGTTDAAGAVEVNHPGGVCWEGSTPDIIGGDVVEVVETSRTTAAEEFGESTVTQQVTARPATVEGSTVVVRGTASDGRGGRLPIDMFEQRIVNPAFLDTDVGRRDIRALADGTGQGTLAYDDATSANWTARYTFADAQTRTAAAEGQTRVLAWQLFDPAGDGGLGSRQGLTIYEAGESGGPGLGGCPASASWAVTGSSLTAVNLASHGPDQPVQQDLVISGTSYDSTSVAVTLDDGDAATAPLTATATPSGTGAQTWSVTFAPAAVLTLSDGTLTASATYTQSGGGTLGGAGYTLLKDLVAPAASVAVPAGGVYAAAQSVVLTSPEGVPVHVTVDGTAPGAQDPVHGAPLRVTADQTVRSVVVDTAGNPSTVREDAYSIEGELVAGSTPPAAVDAPADPAPAPRNVQSPSLAPRNVIVFPERDFVGAEGYAPDQPVTFVVRRNGAVVGTAYGVADATGLVEVNHPGGVCWQGVTPDIRAGDVVEALTDATPGHEQGGSTSTAFVSATQAEPAGEDVIVQGTATDANGNRLASLANLEQRIVNAALVNAPAVGKRHVSAVSDGSGQGSLTYDDATGTTWTARYTGYSPEVDQLLVQGQTRVMSWQAFTTDRQGLTIYEVGETGGPGLGGCPGAADFAVVDASVHAVNIANAGQGLTVHGTAKDSSAVVAHLGDGTTTVDAPGTLTGTGADQTWTATFTAEQVATLGTDTETLRASATYTTTGDAFGAVELPVLKDLTAPDLPHATPASAVYATHQAVTLSNPSEKALAIHYTTDNTNPGADDPRATGQVEVLKDTTLRAVAVDAAGNPSAQRVAVYEIRIPAPVAPTLELAAASDSGARGDGITNDSTPTFTGTAANGTVTLTQNRFVDGVAVSTAIGTASVSNGAWGITPATALGDGTASYTAILTDSGGRSSQPSVPVDLTIDTSSPVVRIEGTRLPASTTRDPQFAFSVSETAAAECSMTGVAAVTSCTSPVSFTGLTDGTKTFVVRATDAAGNAGSASYSYTLDATAPTVQTPNVTLVFGSTVGPTSIPVRITWSGSDGAGTGVARYQLRRTSNGVVGAVQDLSAATTSQSLVLASADSNLIEVRAVDNAGNTGAWATRSFTMKGDDQTTPSVAYTGAWTAGAAQPGSYGGTVAHASASGRNVTYTFTGSTVAWVSTLASNRGRADVYLDGVRVAQGVDLFNATTAAGRVVYANNAVANPTATHTLQIRVLGTKLAKSKGTRVDADAFLSTPAP